MRAVGDVMKTFADTAAPSRLPMTKALLSHAAAYAGMLWLAQPVSAHASFLHGETLDAVADWIALAVLVIAPIVGITVFWLVHILPEKIAEKKNHPQAKAIQTLCLLSLFFGGLLWPIAWLWADSKPVLYKMAYGTDVGDHGDHGDHTAGAAASEHDAYDAQRLHMQVVDDA